MYDNEPFDADRNPPPPFVPAGLTVCAILQMGIQHNMRKSFRLIILVVNHYGGITPFVVVPVGRGSAESNHTKLI